MKDIIIRNDLLPGDIGSIIQLHGSLYSKEYGYGVSFETYVAKGLVEFYQQFDPHKDQVWVCDHETVIVGFILMMHRPKDAAQLRYFILKPEYRGIGLGKKLMDLFMSRAKKCDFKSLYLWTTNEQKTASALYQRYGFKIVEEKPSDAFGKPLLEQKYETSLLF